MASNTFGSDIGQQLHERRNELMRALDDARRALDAFDDAWSEHDYQWLRDAGYITANQCAHMVDAR